MKFIKTEFEGLFIIEPRRIGDARGYFCETFRKDLFQAAVGPVEFIQDNESRSHCGVARGLHYQAGDKAQAKIVRVTEGCVIDYAVDLRTVSPTFGSHIAVELSAQNGRQMYIPRGFAHGFVVVSDTAVFQYKVDNAYCPEAERCIRFDDAALGISFPAMAAELQFSDKDLHGVSFDEAEKF